MPRSQLQASPPPRPAPVTRAAQLAHNLPQAARPETSRSQPQALRPQAAQPQPAQTPLQARAANDGAQLRRYDWESHLAPVEEQVVVAQTSAMLDRAVDATRLIVEKTAWLGNITPRRWAIGAAGVAGIAILGGLGLSLMLDAPDGDGLPAVAVAEPVVPSAIAPETQQLAEAPQVPAAAVSQPAIAATEHQPETAAAPQPQVQAAPQIQAASEVSTPAPTNANTALMQPQASPPPPAAPTNILETNDARWASAAEPETTPQPKKATAQADASPGQPAPAPQSVAPDASTTGGIVPAKPKARKPVAKAPAASDTTETAKPASAAPIGPGSAVVTMAVKMRAGEDNDSDVVKVLPAKANVEVLSCKAWCKVSYDGQEGYVFKRFLKRD